MEVTLWELARRINDLKTSVDRLGEQHVTYREYQADLRSQVERDTSHDRRLKRIEDGQTWMMRGLAGLALAVIVQIVLFLAGVA